MLTYILRRLLYSIPVLIACSFLIFVAVSAMGDPLAELQLNPLASEETIANVREEKHLDDPIPVQYVYWVKDAVTNGFGTPLLQRADLGRPQARHSPHADPGHRGRAHRAPRGRVRSGLLRDPPVLDLRLLRDHAELPRLRHARVLAGADAPDRLHELIPRLERAHLLHVGAEFPSTLAAAFPG